MTVFFILLFFWRAAPHFGKIIGDREHKISFDSSITVLCDQVGTGTPVKTNVLIENVVPPQFKFKVVGFGKGFYDKGVNDCAAKILRE